MPRILLLAYYFPPMNNSGVQRPAKFVKYLPRFEWQPFIITTAGPYDPDENTDLEMLKDIPDTASVLRVRPTRPRPVTDLAKWLGWDSRSSEARPNRTDTAEEPPVCAPQLLARLRHAMLAPLYLIQRPPVDLEIYWSLRIVPLAIRVMRLNRIGTLLTTCPPWSLNVAGLAIKALTGCRWIADFRDPWTINERIYFEQGWRRRLDESLERRVLRRADLVVGVTPRQTNDIASLSSAHNSRSKFVTITNGYDESDIPREPVLNKPSSKITFSHIGVIYRGTLSPLLAALESLSRETSLVARAQIHLVGWMSEDTLERINRSSARSSIVIHSPVSHRQAIQNMQQASVVLLLMDNTPHWSTVLPGKIFELAASGTPILAIAPDGVAADFIHRTGTGLTVHPDDNEGLQRTVLQILADYDGFVDHYYHPDWRMIARHSRRHLTKELVQYLNELA